MADITSKTADTSPTGSDLLYEVDVSDTTDNANGSDKKVTMANVVTKAHGLTGNELLKLSSNVMTTAAAGTDYFAPGGTDIPIADGGTGQSTATAAFDALAPTTTQGDIIVRGASNNERLAIGSAQQFLAVNSGGTALEWVDGGSGGQTLYDHVVAASGGDYTTLQDALDAASSGDTIFVRSGSYALTANKTYAALTDITIIGENPTSSIIDLVTYTLQFDGANIQFVNIGTTATTGQIKTTGVNSSVSGCYIQGTAATTTPLIEQTGDNSKFVNNYCLGSANVCCFIKQSGSYSLVSSCIFRSSGGGTSATIGFVTQTGTSSDNCIGCVFTAGGGSTGTPYIYTTSNLSQISGNTMYPYANSYRQVGIIIAGATAATVSSNFIYDCYDGIYTTASNSNQINNNWIGEVGTNRYQIYCSAANSNITGNTLQNPKTNGYGIYSDEDRINITGNNIAGSAYGVYLTSASQYSNVSSNHIHVSADNLIGIWVGGGQTNITGNSITCATGSGAYGVFVNAGSNYVISSNNFYGLTSTAGTAVYFNSAASARCMISNNGVQSQYGGFNIQGTGHSVIGNSIDTIGGGTSIVTASEIVTIMDNTVFDNGDTTAPVNEHRTVRVKNTSGSTLASGDIVTLKAVAAGNEVTTTTTGGDQKVFGVAMESITTNTVGYVKTLGKVTNLKVDGTTDIAVGDFISTFTSAGIGKKASSGETAIAIALEAYTTDDSNGVIDAILIPPRTV